MKINGIEIERVKTEYLLTNYRAASIARVLSLIVSGIFILVPLILMLTGMPLILLGFAGFGLIFLLVGLSMRKRMKAVKAVLVSRGEIVIDEAEEKKKAVRSAIIVLIIAVIIGAIFGMALLDKMEESGKQYDKSCPSCGRDLKLTSSGMCENCTENFHIMTDFIGK